MKRNIQMFIEYYVYFVLKNPKPIAIISSHIRINISLSILTRLPSKLQVLMNSSISSPTPLFSRLLVVLMIVIEIIE